jgi:hypothetical protein
LPTPQSISPPLTQQEYIQKPENWASIFLQHLATTTQKPAAKPTENPLIPKRKYYNNYQLWRVFPKTTDDVKYLEDYRISPEGSKLQWLKGPSLQGMTDVLIPPNMLQPFKDYLKEEGITYEMVIYDLGRAIMYENPKMSKREQLEIEILQGHTLTWYRYHRLADIVKFMNYLQRKYPKNVELIHIGRSFEGRPLMVAKISSEMVNSKRNKKKYVRQKLKKSAVFIEAGSHGREWIGPSVATWILNVLTNGLNKNGK